MTKEIKSKKLCSFVLAGTLLGTSLLGGGSVFAEEPKTFEQQLVEWEEAGIDVNHTEAIEKVKAYIDQNIDQGVFASLHIDRDENPLGVVVLSFTEELPDSVKAEIKGLVQEPSEVSFRVVKHTEQQLLEKQEEINAVVFEPSFYEETGITVYSTSADILNNKVEIGVDPFNEATVRELEEMFGTDMLLVVQGHQAVTLEDTATTMDASEPEIVPISAEIEPEEKGFFAKIWAWITGLFK